MQTARPARAIVAEVDLSAPCCAPIVFAYFPTGSKPVMVFDRHTGPRCSGTFDRLVYAAWFYQGRHLVAAYNFQGISHDG